MKMYFANIESLQKKESSCSAFEINVLLGKEGGTAVIRSSNLPNTPELLSDVMEAIRETMEEDAPFGVWNGYELFIIPAREVARISIRFI